MCGRLPFAIGIAGRLSASLGVADSGDWSGMLGVLRAESGLALSPQKCRGHV